LKAWLYAHIALCTLGVIFLAASWLSARGWLGASIGRQAAGFAALLLLTSGIAAGSWYGPGICLEESLRRAESADFAGHDVAGGRRRARKILSEFRANHRRSVHPFRVFS